MGQGKRPRLEQRRFLPDQAAQVRAEAEQLRQKWDAYVEAGKALEAIKRCEAIWPSSVRDVAPTQCELMAGHDVLPGDGGGHRHKVPGTRVTVTW